MQEIRLRVNLDKVLKDRNLQQKELVNLLNEKRIERGEDKKVRAASISELYNNQRKSLNKELIEEIATALEIEDIDLLLEFININLYLTNKDPNRSPF